MSELLMSPVTLISVRLNLSAPTRVDRVPAVKPIFLGKTTDTANGYLVLGTLNAAYGRGIYTVSSAKFPYAACVQLILSNGSTTEIVGVDGKRDVKVVERYTPDGQRVSAPVNGINIEKLSDGTTRKVFVQK